MTVRTVSVLLAIGVLVAAAPEASARPSDAHAAADPVLVAIAAARASGGINAGEAATFRGTYANAEHEVGLLSGQRRADTQPDALRVPDAPPQCPLVGSAWAADRGVRRRARRQGSSVQPAGE